MKNLTEILVANDELQDAIDYFIEEIKTQFNVNLNNSIVAEAKIEEITEFSFETFNEYEVYTKELFNLAGALYQEGYNVLERAIEINEKSPLIVNEVLRDYVLDKIIEHQEKMQKSFEKDNQDKLQFELEC